MILKLALCCVSCCLYCLEKTLKYITNFAYIYTAMQGSGFCGSCKDVFKLLLGHMGQMAINAFVAAAAPRDPELGDPGFSRCSQSVGRVRGALGILGVGTRMYAVALIFLMSVFFSRMFASVFETTIDCIFVCAFRDEDDYDARVMAQHHPIPQVGARAAAAEPVRREAVRRRHVDRPEEPRQGREAEAGKREGRGRAVGRERTQAPDGERAEVGP